MKRMFVFFFGFVLFFLLAACGKAKTEAARQDAPVKSAAVNAVARDWKEIYLEELLAAQEYCAAADWEHFTIDSKYPILLYGAELIDLNFDGTPELLLYGPGAGGSQEMRILTISSSGVQMIFNDWGNMSEFTLYRKLGSDDHFFAFTSANGDMTGWKGAYYLTGADTKMDKSFPEAAKFIEFSDFHDYDDEGNPLRSAFTINKKELSENDYIRMMDTNTLFAGYEELPYRPIGMIWGSEGYGDSFSLKLLTEYELMSFLDGFDEEDGMGDFEYSSEDFYRDELIRHVLGNVESAAEMVNEHGMSVLVTGETIELDGKVCEIVILGTNHADQFVREIYYAVYNLEDIYRYDPVDDLWYLIYVFGAVG